MMEDKCGNCKYYKRLYVPPLKWFANIPKDAFVCVGLESEVMWLGDKAENGMCEMFTSTDSSTKTDDSTSKSLDSSTVYAGEDIDDKQ